MFKYSVKNSLSTIKSNIISRYTLEDKEPDQTKTDDINVLFNRVKLDQKRETRKKLLFIVNIPEFFISHRLSLALLAQLKGYEVHVATTYSQNFKKINGYGFKCHKIYLKRGSLNFINDLITFISIYKVLKDLKPDVLHLLTAKCNIYGGLASRIISIPKVVHAITGLGYIFVDTKKNYKNSRRIV